MPGRDGGVVGEKIRLEPRFDEVGAALVRLEEERCDTRLDEVPEALERGDVRGVEAEAARSIGHWPLADRPRDRVVNSASCASNCDTGSDAA